MAWKTGECTRLRSTPSSSTSLSKGSSWWSYAPSALSRTRPSSSPQVGSPDRSARMASMLTKKPISPSVSCRVRPAMGVPTTTSSCAA